MKFTGFAFLTAAALLACAAAFAAESDSSQKKATVTLRNGKVLEDAYVLDRKPNGITVAYKDGCMFILFSEMPVEYQQKFGYDAIKSARYERKVNLRKRALETEEKDRKNRQKKQASDEDKHYRDYRINAQQQTVRKLQLQLDEAKKRLETTERTISQDRSTLGISSVGPSRVSIESPWGYGGRIRSGEHNAAVTNKLLKEVDTLSAKRNNQEQDVIDLQLKLEAAQRILDKMLEGGK